MNVTCTYEHLREGLRDLETIASKNATLPILENILIEAKEDVLFFSATNLELGIIKSVPAKIDESGSIVVPPHMLQGFLAARKGEDHITFFTQDTELFIESGTYKTRIKGLDAKDFPIIPQSTSQKAVSCAITTLQNIIKSVLNFATHVEIRPELTGVFLYKSDENLIGAATDSFRLGEKKVPLTEVLRDKKDTLPFEKIILPQKLAQYITKLQGSQNVITCSVEENHLFLTYGDMQITARLIDGTYPDYQQIIPQKSATTVIFKKEELLEAMRVMLVFADRETSEVSFHVGHDGVEIATPQQDVGDSAAKITASVDGDNQEITLNPRYILDGLAHCDKEDVFMGISGGAAPVVFYGANADGVDKSYTYIVMPVKRT